jgi:hypothetical protein
MKLQKIARKLGEFTLTKLVIIGFYNDPGVADDHQYYRFVRYPWNRS